MLLNRNTSPTVLYFCLHLKCFSYNNLPYENPNIFEMLKSFSCHTKQPSSITSLSKLSVLNTYRPRDQYRNVMTYFVHSFYLEFLLKWVPVYLMVGANVINPGLTSHPGTSRGQNAPNRIVQRPETQISSSSMCRRPDVVLTLPRGVE